MLAPLAASRFDNEKAMGMQHLGAPQRQTKARLAAVRACLGFALSISLSAALLGACTTGRSFATGATTGDGGSVPDDVNELEGDAESDDEEDGSAEDGEPSAEDGADASVDEDEDTATLFPEEALTGDMMRQMLSTFAYRGEGFARANGAFFPSTVAPGKMIDMWVSEAALNEMLLISPERAGSEVEVPTGTMIVREVWDQDVLSAITVMVKLEKGAFPLGGDFWYLQTDAEANVKLDAAGTPIMGLRSDCGTCHLRRSHDGFLFGTPDAYLP